MKKIFRVAIFVVFALFLILGAFGWIEAEKEVRILCSMFPAGTTEADVVRMLNTGNFLQYEPLHHNETSGYIINSPYTLRTSTCKVIITESGLVESSSYRQSIKLQMTLAALLLLIAITLLYYLLIHGKISGKRALFYPHDDVPSDRKGNKL
jgi:hypothetical protein